MVQRTTHDAHAGVPCRAQLDEPPPIAGRAVGARRRTLVALIVWAALIAISAVWGAILVARGARVGSTALPLTGHFAFNVGPLVVPALAIAAFLVITTPRRCERLAWRSLLVYATFGSLAWALALAVIPGWGGLTDPFTPHTQYLVTVPRIVDVSTYLSQFTRYIYRYSIHTQGHPPGMVLLLWALAKVGLGGAGANAALVFGGGALTAPAVLVTVREVADEHTARVVAPFLILVPAMLWWGSGDALFMGVSAWAIALIVLATGRRGVRGDAFALGGGLLFGATAFLSYGLVLLILIPIVIAIARRRIRPLVFAAFGALPVFLAFASAGFWWFDGLAATRRQYFAGIAHNRPGEYYVLGNLAAFALAVGPAVAVGLARLRDRRIWLLVGAAIAVVLLADFSGMSKSEVERIWLPFVPWIVLATVALTGSRERSRQWWLAAQVTTAFVVQGAVWSAW